MIEMIWTDRTAKLGALKSINLWLWYTSVIYIMSYGNEPPLATVCLYSRYLQGLSWPQIPTPIQASSVVISPKSFRIWSSSLSGYPARFYSNRKFIQQLLFSVCLLKTYQFLSLESTWINSKGPGGLMSLLKNITQLLDDWTFNLKQTTFCAASHDPMTRWPAQAIDRAATAMTARCRMGIAMALRRGQQLQKPGSSAPPKKINCWVVCWGVKLNHL